MQVFLSEATFLESGARITKRENRYYKERQFCAVTKWSRAVKNWANNLLQSGEVATAKWGNYYKAG